MELYREMPCYAIPFEIGLNRDELVSRADKDFLGDEYRRLICEDDDRLADPVCYWLWCHDFEDAEAVSDLWARLSAPGALTTRGQERLLGMSGTVPWDLKAALYERLIADSKIALEGCARRICHRVLSYCVVV